MGTKRDGRFYARVWKRLMLRGAAFRSSEPDARLVEQCRNSEEVLKPELLVVERELEGLCYGEYAYLTPYEKDELFLQAFNRAAKAMWSTHHIRGMGADDELKNDWVHSTLELNVPEVRSALRNARQHYDALGLQYYPAILWVINEHIRYNGGYGIPRPNQLASHLALAALQENDRWISERFEAPFSQGEPNPRFQACNYTGHWGQNKALDAIQTYVEGEPNRSRVLSRYLVDGLISEEEARRRFGDDLVDATLAAFGPARFETNGGAEDPPRTDRRACLGLSYDTEADMCCRCPVRSECVDITERVLAVQIEVFGDPNPRKVQERESAAARQRKLRAANRPEHKALVAAITANLSQILGPRFRTGELSRSRNKGRNKR